MSKRFRIGAVSLLIAIVGVIAWQELRKPPEPIYQGKPLTVWLRDYIAGGSVIGVFPNPKTDETVRQIGTNAIPTLLYLLRMHDSNLKLELMALAGRQQIVNIRFPLSWWWEIWQAQEAAHAFGALGPDASNAVPQLIQIYRDNVGIESQMGCLESLAEIGPSARQAIPELLGAVTNANPRMRRIAIRGLVNLHVEHRLLMPILINGLQDSIGGIRFPCLQALAAFGPEAKAAIPELTIMLQDPNPYIKTNAAFTLKAIDPEAAAKAGVH